MAVPIPTSVGYEGTVNEAQWATLLANAGGRQYGVSSPGAWKVTAGGSDREVRIAAGGGFGFGVFDTSTSVASLTLPAPSSGSRWHLIVVRRDWQANQSSFDSVAGPTGAAALPVREQSPGTIDDQPIALVRVQAGQSQVVEIRDLRVWGGDGGSFGNDRLALQYLSRVGTRIRIAGVEWTRILNSVGSPEWSSTRAPATGFFVGATANQGEATPAGTVTVIHDLGVTPSAVLVTDRNVGAIPGTRKVTYVTANETSIQFAVFNEGALLVNNPVEFNWVAFA